MPPANTPDQTRPSTPPPYNFPTSYSSLSSHPYLQQLEEAISTPVPDLASTLTTPESRSRTGQRTVHHRATSSDARTYRTVASLSDVGREIEQRLRGDELYWAASNEQISRIQGEVERWQHERERLSDILQGQEERYGIGTGQEEEAMERRRRASPGRRQEAETLLLQRSRLSRIRRHEHTAPRPITLRAEPDISGLLSRDEEEDDGAASVTAMMDGEGDVDSGPRRELERALRNYRIARNAFRSERQQRHGGAGDVGQVPTASALRAYWNEEPNRDGHTSDDRQSQRRLSALGDFVEQHRADRHRRQLENTRRLNEQQAQLEGQYDHHRISRDLARQEASDSEAFIRVRNTIRYLADLRHTRAPDSLDLAKSLNLDALHEYSDANAPSDLPLSAEALPRPCPSTWLKPGMTWHGFQSSDRDSHRPAVLASTIRRRHGDYVGRAIARREAYDMGQAHRNALQSLSHRASSSLSSMSDQDIVASAAYHYSRNALWHPHNLRPAPELPPLRFHGAASPLPPSSPEPADNWPVTVTLHDIDWAKMTVSGTMRASQIPNRVATTVTNTISSNPNTHSSDPSNPDNPNSETNELENGKSMESFFHGEILDFQHHHTLLSEGSSSGTEAGTTSNYKVGGVDVDARYWSRLGPFREEIERAERRSSLNKQVDGGNDKSRREGKVGKTDLEAASRIRDGEWDYNRGQGGGGGSSSATTIAMGGDMSSEEKQRREREAEEVIARCLASQSWLREKAQGEWVLMRWKEKCFVDPIMPPLTTSTSTSTSVDTNTSSSSSASNPTPSQPTTIVSTSEYPSTSATLLGDRAQAQWGLTISGFYYIALHRQSGSIDGLYYDPGSRPYQSLRMAPEGVKLEQTVQVSETTGMVRPRDGEFVGMRRSFPAIEFR